MYAPRLPRIGTYAAWRDTARRLARAEVPAAAVDWGLAGDGASMFDRPLPVERGEIRVPASFADLSRSLIPERSGRGMTLAYALLVRLQEEQGLLSNRADRQVAQARDIAKTIHRDLHKMHAFVRFREMPAGKTARRRFAAWFEPDHRIEEPTADFFVNRFGDMDWTIVTPEVTIRYVDRVLDLKAVESLRPEGDDPLEQLWTTYYSNIFNPARLKPDAMRAEMPMKYWRNLPEARVIPSLIADARARTLRMQEAGPTTPAPNTERRKEMNMNRDMPDLFGAPALPELMQQMAACERCPLYAPATQVVPGEGPPDAPVMLVGEQPGDQEDIAGRPFVGPAGQLFDTLSAEVGFDRRRAYVTNAVKHFKFVQKGRRRIHQSPAASEISACRWWLDQELSTVDPDLVVAMGATALHALTGNGKGLLKRRGGVEETKDGRPLLVTLHPSYLLRLPDPQGRERATADFRSDLRRIPELLAG